MGTESLAARIARFDHWRDHEMYEDDQIDSEYDDENPLPEFADLVPGRALDLLYARSIGCAIEAGDDEDWMILRPPRRKYLRDGTGGYETVTFDWETLPHYSTDLGVAWKEIAQPQIEAGCGASIGGDGHTGYSALASNGYGRAEPRGWYGPAWCLVMAGLIVGSLYRMSHEERVVSVGYRQQDGKMQPYAVLWVDRESKLAIAAHDVRGAERAGVDDPGMLLARIGFWEADKAYLVNYGWWSDTRAFDGRWCKPWELDRYVVTGHAYNAANHEEGNPPRVVSGPHPMGASAKGTPSSGIVIMPGE